jgi:hypothetical protein
MDQYLTLYNFVNHLNVTVANVMGSTPLNIGFRRVLSGRKWDRWVHLVTRLMGVNCWISQMFFGGLSLLRCFYCQIFIFEFT